MEAILTDNPVESPTDKAVVRLEAAVEIEIEEKAVELGIWLSGLCSYMGAGTRSLDQTDVADKNGLAVTEFKIAHSGIRRCILLNSYILSQRSGLSDIGNFGEAGLNADELGNLSDVLREALLVTESLISSPVLSPVQWREWSALLSHRLEATAAFYDLVHLAERSGSKFLPARLAELGNDAKSLTPEHAELVLVLPRFGMVLKWLSVVKKMLDADKPLKSSLLIFSRVNELILDLTAYIGNRLDRFPNQDAEFFSTLDAASYTASIELKKVYTQELAGVASMRPPPSIYARIETAYSLLNDGFQQILAGFMRIVEPGTEVFRVFPEFEVKKEQSLVLTSDLWPTLEIVKAAETTPTRETIERMKRALNDFRQGSMRYLFYKDTETVERFIEEILVTNQNKDLIPILHRFGAFLDTLFGQVALRSVLEKHPFDRIEGQ